MAAYSSAMNMEEATEQEQPLVAATAPRSRFSRPVLALAAVSATALIYAAPWRVVTAVPAERTSMEVAMQQLSEAHAEALFQVHDRLLEELSSATEAKDDKLAASEECEFEEAADGVCNMDPCQSSCTGIYRNVMRDCGPKSKQSKLARQALQKCHKEPSPGGSAAPHPPMPDEQEMEKCAPSLVAVRGACPMEGGEGELPDMAKMCAEDCQGALQDMMKNCPSLMAGGQGASIGMLTSMCDTGSCSNAVMALSPGSPGGTACNMGHSGPDKAAACSKDCQKSLCGVSTNCDPGKKNDFPGPPEALKGMQTDIDSMTEKCPCA